MVDVAAAWVTNEQAEILICRRAESEPRAGYWEFPGGKFEPEEDGPLAVVRELKEELDLDVICQDLITTQDHNYGNFQVRIHLYRCIPAEANAIPKLFVHDACLWCKAENLQDYNFLPGDIPLIQRVLDQIP